jgi:hypothetical protein
MNDNLSGEEQEVIQVLESIKDKFRFINKINAETLIFEFGDCVNFRTLLEIETKLRELNYMPYISRGLLKVFKLEEK